MFFVVINIIPEVGAMCSFYFLILHHYMDMTVREIILLLFLPFSAKTLLTRSELYNKWNFLWRGLSLKHPFSQICGSFFVLTPFTRQNPPLTDRAEGFAQ